MLVNQGRSIPVTFAVIMPTNHKLLAAGRDHASAETRELLVRWGPLRAPVIARHCERLSATQRAIR